MTYKCTNKLNKAKRKNVYVPSEVPGKCVFRTLFRQAINDCEDKKHQA